MHTRVSMVAWTSKHSFVQQSIKSEVLQASSHICRVHILNSMGTSTMTAARAD